MSCFFLQFHQMRSSRSRIFSRGKSHNFSTRKASLSPEKRESISVSLFKEKDAAVVEEEEDAKWPPNFFFYGLADKRVNHNMGAIVTASICHKTSHSEPALNRFM